MHAYDPFMLYTYIQKEGIYYIMDTNWATFPTLFISQALGNMKTRTYQI